MLAGNRMVALLFCEALKEWANMGSNLRKIDEGFFKRPVDVVAMDLVGKIIVREQEGKEIFRMRIRTTEAYGGLDDTASHYYKGQPQYIKENPHTLISPFFKHMELSGGHIYIGYSRGFTLNIATGNKGDAQAVLIREIEEIDDCKIQYKKDKNIISVTNILGELGMNDYCKFVGKSIFSDELQDKIWIEADDYEVAPDPVERKLGSARLDNEDDGRRKWGFSLDKLL
jgi:3-methyladenine DNA glycosylase Mpg